MRHPGQTTPKEDWIKRLKSYTWLTPREVELLNTMRLNDFTASGCSQRFTSGGARAVCDMIARRLLETHGVHYDAKD